jgi:SAM-dependent methyltransferase
MGDVMKNPWLDIPLADYEGHMALPNVAQAQLLSDIFAGALITYAPRSVAVLGCAGGNGLERVSSKVTERVVAVDLNPEYVQQVRTRFDRQIPLLELFAGDVQTDQFGFSPVELVFAGLLFEYVDADAVLRNIRQMLRPGGTLLAVLQLPSSAIPEITPSPFASLCALSSVMRLVPPGLLKQLAAAHGYSETEARTVEATGGKEFEVQTFRLETPDHSLQPTPVGERV